MTHPVPTLAELAARVTAQNYEVVELSQLDLPAELIQYMASVSSEVELSLAGELHARFFEIKQSFAAMDNEQAEPQIAAQFLVAFDQLAALQDQASAVLAVAISEASNVEDDQWRAYLLQPLVDAQSTANAIGAEIELFRSVLTAYANGDPMGGF